jgi:hypothetical protein
MKDPDPGGPKTLLSMVARTHHNVNILMTSLDPRLGLAHDPIHEEIQRVPHLHVPRLDVRPVDLRLDVALDAAPVALHRLYGAVQVVVVVCRRVEQDGLEVDGRARHLQAGPRIQSRNTRTELTSVSDPDFYIDAGPDPDPDPGGKTNADAKPCGSGSWSDYAVTKSWILTLKIFFM